VRDIFRQRNPPAAGRRVTNSLLLTLPVVRFSPRPCASCGEWRQNFADAGAQIVFNPRRPQLVLDAETVNLELTLYYLYFLGKLYWWLVVLNTILRTVAGFGF
jgi:hypothetical protein